MKLYNGDCLEVMKELEKKYGRISNAVVPKNIYRIVSNKDSNDFNNEYKFVIIKYEVYAYDHSECKYWATRTGFQNKHWVSNNIYFTKEEAQQKLKELEGK